MINGLYKESLTLLTDLYQLTMAYGYWKAGIAEKEAVFHLFFRNNPFGGGYAIHCGLEYVVDYLNHFKFEESDIEYLSTLEGNDGTPLFDEKFLAYLKELNFTCDVDAIQEGEVVFPHEPLIRIKGPILQAQLLETPLLTLTNFQTLIATKASRIAYAARGEQVLEFGLRRAQGIDGALAASRSSYIGGTTSTSNVMAGKMFGIPVAGTHAHSWILTFENELEAFNAYAEALPNNCIFLVDTYDTINGIQNAIRAGQILKEKGRDMVGIRIDSGDLAYLSTIGRKMLDEAGFKNARIFASNDLDEHLMQSLKAQKAQIDVWGIGTKLVTAYDQPALGAVYKLSAIKGDNGQWIHKIKLSEQAVKVNNPGIQQVKRFMQNDQMVADMIYDELSPPDSSSTIIDPMDNTRRKHLDCRECETKDLLIPIFRNGMQVCKLGSIFELKEKAVKGLEQLHEGIKRFENPHKYPVGLESGLHQTKTDLILKLRHLDNEDLK